MKIEIKHSKLLTNHKELVDSLQKEIVSSLNKFNQETDKARLSGTNSLGKKFRPYSKSYQEAISKKQVRGKVDPSTVNLTQTGMFRRSMVVDQLPDGAQISVIGSRAGTTNSELFDTLESKGFTDILTFSEKAKQELEININKLIGNSLTKVIKITDN